MLYEEPAYIKEMRRKMEMFNGGAVAKAFMIENKFKNPYLDRFNETAGQAFVRAQTLVNQHSKPVGIMEALMQKGRFSSENFIAENIRNMTATSYLQQFNNSFRDKITPTAASILSIHEQLFRKEHSVIGKIQEQFSKTHLVSQFPWIREVEENLSFEYPSENQTVTINAFAEILEVSKDEVTLEQYEELLDTYNALNSDYTELQNNVDSLMTDLIEIEKTRNEEEEKAESQIEQDKVEDYINTYTKKIQKFFLSHNIFIEEKPIYYFLSFVVFVLKEIIKISIIKNLLE